MRKVMSMFIVSLFTMFMFSCYASAATTTSGTTTAAGPPLPLVIILLIVLIISDHIGGRDDEESQDEFDSLYQFDDEEVPTEESDHAEDSTETQ